MKKQKLGQYNTMKDFWLTKNVKEFIKKGNFEMILDPFAGNGDILKIFKDQYYTKGFDIDKSKGWRENDSLIGIPKLKEKTIVITNPPYLYKSRFKRLAFDKDSFSYFKGTKHDNLYLIAIEKTLEVYDNAIFIIPESFTNKIKTYQKYIYSIDVIEKNPFEDTEVPVCVVCFSKEKEKNINKLYKNERFVSTIKDFLEVKEKIKPEKKAKILFNEKKGWLAARLFDLKKEGTIQFFLKDDLSYNYNDIKSTSRNYTLISTGEFFPKNPIDFVKNLNNSLNELRKETGDLVLTAFKGNTNKGFRRRRLDFKTARFLIEDEIKKEA